jgi:hypothetical protein
MTRKPKNGRKEMRKHAANTPLTMSGKKLLKGDCRIGTAETSRVTTALTPFADTETDEEDDDDEENEEISFGVRVGESVAFQGARFRKTVQLTAGNEQSRIMYELRYRASVEIDAALSNVHEDTPKYDALVRVPSGTIAQPYPDINDIPSGKPIEVWLVSSGTDDYAVSELDASLLSEVAVRGGNKSEKDELGNVYRYIPGSVRERDGAIDTISIVLANNDVYQINLGLQRGTVRINGAQTYEIVYLSLWMDEGQYGVFRARLRVSAPPAVAPPLVEIAPATRGGGASKIVIPGASVSVGFAAMDEEEEEEEEGEAVSWKEYHVRNSRYKHVVVPGSRTLVGGIRVSVPVHLEIGPEVELSERPDDIVTLMLQGNTLELEYRRDASQMGSGTFKLRSIRLEAPEVESWRDALAWWHRYHNQRVPINCANPYNEVAAEYGYADVERVRTEAMYT